MFNILLITLSVLTISEIIEDRVDAQNCPVGWEQQASSCFMVKVNAFGFFESVVKAQQECRNEGGELATVATPEAESVVSQLLDKAAVEFNLVTTNRAYVGLTDVESANNFKWFDPSAIFNSSVSDSNVYFTTNDRRCVMMTSDGWMANPVAITYKVTPCCYNAHDVQMAVCSRPSTGFAAPINNVTFAYCLGACPKDWIRFENRCYTIMKRENSVVYARAVCKNAHADLAYVTSQNIVKLLAYLARTNNITWLYVGISDIGASFYRNLNNTQIIGGSWLPDEPSNLVNGFQVEDCVAAKLNRSTIDLNYNDVFCCVTNLNMHHFACEKPEVGNVIVSEDLIFQSCAANVTSVCLSNPCKNNGVCSMDVSNANINYLCNCITGTSGINCENNIDDCATFPCLNGGTCIDGYNSYSCQCSGSYGPPNCQNIVECNDITVKNAVKTNYTGTGRRLNDTRTYSCLPSYKFPDASSVRVFQCTNTNSWNDTIIDCKLSCSIVPVVENAIITTNTIEVNTTMIFTCLKGFEIDGNNTQISFYCQMNNEWNKEPMGNLCTAKKCPQLPIWLNQHLEPLNVFYTYPTVVNIWCDVGFVFFDYTTARTLKCKDDGQWTAKLPSCNPVSCPVLTLPANMTRNTTQHSYLTRVQYTCASGYRMLDGSTFRVALCDAGGQWSDEFTDCQKDRCFPLPYVANATPSSTNASHWNVVTLTCIKGHKFLTPIETDMKTMTCQSSGWWYPLFDGCKPIYCSEISPVGVNISPDTNKLLYGTIRTYTCAKGYYIDSSLLLKTFVAECLETKVWNVTSVPSCYPIQCPAPPAASINGTMQKLTGAYTNYSSTITYFCNQADGIIPGKRFIEGTTTKKKKVPTATLR